MPGVSGPLHRHRWALESFAVSLPIFLPIPVLLPPTALAPASTGPDPTAFLAAVASVSAAMVAITGGLLVAKFVTISSEQEGAERLVRSARARLDRAKVQAALARNAAHLWKVFNFFEAKVIHAVGEGEQDVGVLRQLGEPTLLTDEEISSAVETLDKEFAKARAALEPLLADRSDDDFVYWGDFQRIHRDRLPHTSWSEVWQDAYEGLLLEAEPAEPEPDESDWPHLTSPLVLRPLLAPEYDVRRLNKRDELLADEARTKQQIEDLNDELERLVQEREAIVRPKGLGSGLAVLGFFTVVGVVVPLWVMSKAPDRLTAHLGDIVFWLFFVGLVALLGHMGWLGLRLAGWRRNSYGEAS